ncbi:MAG: hypothetical protein R2856_15650 [Caldilineaceae bacterium]
MAAYGDLAIYMTKYTGDYTEQIPCATCRWRCCAVTEAILKRTDLKNDRRDHRRCADHELVQPAGPRAGRRRVSGLRGSGKNRYIDPQAAFEIVKESPALALIDAPQRFPHRGRRQGQRLAIEKAKVWWAWRGRCATVPILDRPRHSGKPGDQTGCIASA